MHEDLSRRFHRSSKESSGAGAHIPKNPDEWPAEWLTIEYKTYPRLPHVALRAGTPSAVFFELARSRSSGRTFSGEPLSIADISTLLKYSCGIVSQGDGLHRAYPSAGTRYPLEVYPLVLRGSTELPAGLYHYGVQDHGLDVLWQRDFTDEEIGSFFTYKWARRAAVVFLVTAVFERMQSKYGERGYRYVLIETGHLGQNMYLVSRAIGRNCCVIGTHDEMVEKLIDIDGTTESLVYALALG